MLHPINISIPTPARKVKGYRMPKTRENLVSWDFAAEQMSRSRHDWICTVFPDSRPRVVPVWGIWHETRFHFEGSRQTVWGRNILKNMHIAVHLPGADQVVILEGNAHIIEDDEIDSNTWDILDTLFQKNTRWTRVRLIFMCGSKESWPGMVKH